MTKITFIITTLLLSTFTTRSQTPDELYSIAVNNNLEIKTLKLEHQTALEKAPQVSQLPQPELGIGLYPFPVETRLGPQLTRLSATQMLPWQGARDSRADVENAKAKALYERIAAKQLDLFFEIKKAWYQLYETGESQAILKRNFSLLESLERLALAKIESGEGSTADVLRIQLKTDELKQEIKILENAKINPRVEINQLLNRAWDTPISVSDKLDFAVILFDKNSLLSDIRDSHPTLRMFELQQEISKKVISANKLDGKPTFGVGLDYIMVNQRKDVELESNGRDILQIRGSVKIPIYRKKYEAKEKEENLKIAALENKKSDLLSRFQASIEKAYASLQNAQLKIELYQQQKETTQAAINILETAYSTQGSRFDELLQLEKENIDYDLKILRAIVQSHIAKSSIERFIVY